jgi:hypothetical protein
MMVAGMAGLGLVLGASPVYAESCKSGPPAVTYERGVFTVTFCPASMAEDCVESPCDRPCQHKPCYVGATVRRAKDGFQFDLPAKEITVADPWEPITLSAKVGPGYVEYVVAVWPDKVSCKDAPSSRHGCSQYGYLLTWGDGGEGYWSHPSDAYWSHASRFADIQPMKVQLLDAGGGSELVARAKSTLSDFTVVDGGPATAKREHVEVLYRAKWERGFAWAIAKQLRDAKIGIRWDAKHWPDAPEDFVVALGGI